MPFVDAVWCMNVQICRQDLDRSEAEKKVTQQKNKNSLSELQQQIADLQLQNGDSSQKLVSC